MHLIVKISCEEANCARFVLSFDYDIHIGATRENAMSAPRDCLARLALPGSGIVERALGHEMLDFKLSFSFQWVFEDLLQPYSECLLIL